MTSHIEGRPAPAGRKAALSALVTVRWGDHVVATRHLEGDSEAVVGAAAATIAAIPCEPAGGPAVVVARVRDGAVVAFVPQGAVGFRERAREIPSPVGGPSELTLAASETVSFSIGAFLITVTAEEASKAPWAALSPLRGSFTPARYFLAAAFAHALLIGLSAQAAHASSLVQDEVSDHGQIAQYLAAADERSRAREDVRLGEFGSQSLGADVNDHDGNGTDGGGTRAAGREGRMGSTLSRAQSSGRFAVSGKDAREATIPSTREEALADAGQFGVAGTLASQQARAPISGFAHAATNGPDPFGTNGAMWATTIGETAGAGGLGLSGVGEGGGGTGEGSIGLGAIGTIGHTFGREGPGTGGGGGLFGIGFGVSWGGSWHHPWGVGVGVRRIGTIGHGAAQAYDLSPRPRERPEKAQEEGEPRLPPDAIRRIVRQSHGRFRLCYQAGLVRNPQLAGGVTTRFLIGAGGRVQSAQNLGTDLPDPAVVSCVTRAFQGLVFPEPPEGRPVTVTYPLTFSPDR